MKTKLPLLKRCAIVLACVLMTPVMTSGQERPGPHELQSRDHPDIGVSARVSLSFPKAVYKTKVVVYGYHPYWIPDAVIDEYDFRVLSHVAYFSYEVNPLTGLPNKLHDWLTSPLLARAQAGKTRVHLCVTNFGSQANTTLLSNPAARDTLIANLVRLVQRRQADGVNIDFESVPVSQRGNLVTFFKDLSQRLRAAVPRAEVAAAVPAVDWSGSWDLRRLAPYIDLFFIMGYNYYWSGSQKAGPVAPLDGGNFNLAKTVAWYLRSGVPAGKIVLGLPYYGLDWPVTSGVRQAATSGRATARTFSRAVEIAADKGRRFDSLFVSAWSPYQVAGSWRQLWYDDELSLEAKYRFALGEGLAGVGMWALGYDAGRTELWDLLRSMFLIPNSVASGENAPSTPVVAVYPNPYRDFFSFVIKGWKSEREELAGEIVDSYGRIIYRWKELVGTGRVYVKRVQAGRFPRGILFYKLHLGNVVRTGKVIHGLP